MDAVVAGTKSISLPVTISSVSKSYGSFVALDRVSLDVASGEFITLLGPSGSGKTTLLMVLAGFIRPDSGAVHFGDRDVSLLAPHKRDVGMVFQNYALFPHMSVGGNIGYPLRLRKVGQAEIADRVRRALDLVQLGGLGERKVDQLSGGQRQRVTLARAVIFEPRILLMDEPLSALDKKLREQMQIEVRHLHQRLGMTTVYVTHDQREALTMSDRIAVVDKGRFRQIGTPRDIYERPASRFIAEFIGESSFVPVTSDGHQRLLGGRLLKFAQPPKGAGPELLVVRPEKLAVVSDGVEGDFNTLQGVVKEIVYQGESSLIYIALDEGGEIAIRQTTVSGPNALTAVGQTARLALAPADTIFVPAGEAT